jgi:sec-independent protein translocase protein TatB
MDASLPEFVLLFVIGLIVLGPERMAQVARKLGQFFGYARRMSRNLQTQLEDELELKRIRDSLPERVDLKAQLGIDEIEKDLKSIADEVEGRAPNRASASDGDGSPRRLTTADTTNPVTTDPDDEGTEHNDTDWDEEAEAADDDYEPLAPIEPATKTPPAAKTGTSESS